MTKKKYKKGKNRKHFVSIPFNGNLALSTLADDALVKTVVVGPFGEDIWTISMDIAVTVRDLTTGETPLRFGVAHGDLTTAEIDESNVAELLDPDDIIQKERSRRPVRKVGQITGTGTQLQFNDGKYYRQKLGISIGNDHNLDIWIKNQSGATLTTGSFLEFDGVLFGRWQR